MEYQSWSIKQMALVLAVVLGGAFLYWRAQPKTEGREVVAYTGEVSKKDNLDGYAYAQSQYYIKEFIKSPSTSDFPWSPDNYIISDNVYHVVGHFDSQNSFGAMLRSKFNCIVKYNGGAPESNTSWNLVELWIDGNKIYYNEQAYN